MAVPKPPSWRFWLCESEEKPRICIFSQPPGRSTDGHLRFLYHFRGLTVKSPKESSLVAFYCPGLQCLSIPSLLKLMLGCMFVWLCSSWLGVGLCYLPPSLLLFRASFFLVGICFLVRSAAWFFRETHGQKPYVAWFYLYEISRVGRSIEIETKLVVAKGWGQRVGEVWGMTANRNTGFPWGDGLYPLRWWFLWYVNYNSTIERLVWDFLDSPVVKTLCFHCRGRGAAKKEKRRARAEGWAPHITHRWITWTSGTSQPPSNTPGETKAKFCQGSWWQ